MKDHMTNDVWGFDQHRVNKAEVDKASKEIQQSFNNENRPGEDIGNSGKTKKRNTEKNSTEKEITEKEITEKEATEKEITEKEATEKEGTEKEKENAEAKKTEKDTEANDIKDFGQLTLENGSGSDHIHLITIIGEVEGHENLSQNTKTTKYEHILPELAKIEDSDEIDGVLILLNTAGGDIDAGLAIAEMIASISKPTVSLVLGGSHSIGVPLAVSSDFSFIVPTGTMLVHPVRMTGMVIGAPQTYEYFKRIQDRITSFTASHSKATQEKLEKMMMETGEMTKDLGTILIGEDAVKEGLIDAVGGINDALSKLHEMIHQ